MYQPVRKTRKIRGNKVEIGVKWKKGEGGRRARIFRSLTASQLTDRDFVGAQFCVGLIGWLRGVIFINYLIGIVIIIIIAILCWEPMWATSQDGSKTTVTMMVSKRKIVSIHLPHWYTKHEGLRTNNRVLHRPRSFPVTVIWVVSFFPGRASTLRNISTE